MDKFIEYSPVIIVIIAFAVQYRIFITPAQLETRINDLEKILDKKFVHRETYDIVTERIKADIAEIKEKIDKMYGKIMGKD